MKKIIIFSTAYLPLIGGAEVAVKELTERIGEFEFDMITAKMDTTLQNFERVGKVNVHRVGWGWRGFDKFLLPMLGCLKARQLNKKKHYDLIWSIMASQASVAAAFFKNSQPKIKLLLTLQEGDEEEHLKRYALGINFLYRLFIKPWHALVFKKADFVTAISNYLKERALKNGVKCPIEIVPNGVDIKNFSAIYQESELNELKQKLGKKPEEKFIITTSRLVRKNAVDDVIKSLQYLPAHLKFLILGGGPDLGFLQNLAKEYKVENRVIFLGEVSHGEMPKYLKVSDVFVRPSLSEGLGNSFLEAMAAEVPVIGTPVGGIPDFLIDGETGLFCEVRNPESIAQKVKMILEDSDLREKIIKNAKELVIRKYNWDSLAQKMVNIFNRLIIKQLTH